MQFRFFMFVASNPSLSGLRNFVFYENIHINPSAFTLNLSHQPICIHSQPFTSTHLHSLSTLHINPSAFTLNTSHQPICIHSQHFTSTHLHSLSTLQNDLRATENEIMTLKL